jgi:hypothetical protein
MVGRRAMERRECQERLESCHRATAAVEPGRELVVATTGGPSRSPPRARSSTP